MPAPPHEPPELPVRRRLLLPLLPGTERAPAKSVEASSDLEPSQAELHSLLSFAEATSLSTDLATAAGLLLETVVSTYGFARGALLAGEHHLAVIAAHGLDGDPSSPGVSMLVRAAQEAASQVIMIPDPELEPWLSGLVPRGAELLVQPLVKDQRRFGALVLQVPSALPAPRRPVVYAQVARLAAMTSESLYREHRLRQLQRLAATDDLTMIANRRSFDDALERELARAVRSGEPLSLALLDLDLFKRVNDVFGHPAGDEVLRNVAASLVVACRELDTPARYGGEEFAIILPDCAPEHCLAIVERLRLAVAAAPGPTAITASAGVATFPHHASSMEELIAAADHALLAAKRAGRNQTLLAQASVAGAPLLPVARGTDTDTYRA